MCAPLASRAQHMTNLSQPEKHLQDADRVKRSRLRRPLSHATHFLECVCVCACVGMTARPLSEPVSEAVVCVAHTRRDPAHLLGCYRRRKDGTSVASVRLQPLLDMLPVPQVQRERRRGPAMMQPPFARGRTRCIRCTSPPALPRRAVDRLTYGCRADPKRSLSRRSAWKPRIHGIVASDWYW